MSISCCSGRSWHYGALLAAAFVCIGNAEVRSQSPAGNAGASDPPATESRPGQVRSLPFRIAEIPDEPQPDGPSLAAQEPSPAPASPLPSPPQAPVDLDALKQMIREELKAERDRQDEEGRKTNAEEEKTAQPHWWEVGHDLKLETFVNNGFVAETADKAFRFHFGGRFDFDNAWYTQDQNLLIGTSPMTQLEDGSDFRRARLRADGTGWGFIDFAAEVSFATIQDVANVDNSTVPVGSVGLTDFYLTFRDLPVVGNLRVGHFVAPYSLERYTSSNVWYYMERSSVYDAFFDPNNYQNGLMLFNSYLDDRATLASSFTRVGHSTLNSFGFDAQDGLYAAGVRLTGLPIYRDDGRMLMHLGFDYFHQALSAHTFAVANRMPLRAGGGPNEIPNLLATGNFFTPNGADLFDFEWAFVDGPFALSAEYALARVTDVFDSFNGVNFSGPRGNVTYQAFYVESGYFLTPGDGRRYDKKTGTWARTVPQQNAFIAKGEDGTWCHGHGAVQLLARYTYLDLVSGSPTLTPASTSSGAQAGVQQDVTLGVNWYLNPQTIVSCNYVWTHLASIVAGASGSIQGVGIRFHFDF
jgi:phosphate-selective porin OprO/OprP